MIGTPFLKITDRLLCISLTIPPPVNTYGCMNRVFICTNLKTCLNYLQAKRQIESVVCLYSSCVTWRHWNCHPFYLLHNYEVKGLTVLVILYIKGLSFQFGVQSDYLPELEMYFFEFKIWCHIINLSQSSRQALQPKFPTIDYFYLNFHVGTYICTYQ